MTLALLFQWRASPSAARRRLFLFLDDKILEQFGGKSECSVDFDQPHGIEGKLEVAVMALGCFLMS
jgi:hypothetical protein